MTNTGGNTKGQVVRSVIDAHDEATQKLSPEFKEFLSQHDVGGYSHAQLWDLIQQQGEARVRLIILVNKNYAIYETYGKSHPDFNPRLPFLRPKR